MTSILISLQIEEIDRLRKDDYVRNECKEGVIFFLLDGVEKIDVFLFTISIFMRNERGIEEEFYSFIFFLFHVVTRD